MNFGKDILKKAKKLQKTIVFPESDDDRVLRAVALLYKKKIVKPVLVGDPEEIHKRAKKLRISLKNIPISHPTPTVYDHYADILFKTRKKKTFTLAKAKAFVRDDTTYAALLVKDGHADGMVSGATHPTAHTIRSSLKVIGPRKKVASSFFFIELKKEVLVFADCGFNISPTAEELAHIAVDTAKSAKAFGIKARVAMLSFSTHGSAKHPDAEKMIEATRMAKRLTPNLIIDGELQFDSAFVPEVQKRKAPQSSLKGKSANVFIFPDLNSGNIAYKIAQRLGHAQAYGPILQGFAKATNDLSRGCTVEEIMVVAAITALQAEQNAS